MRPNREVRSVSPAWWICCPFALFINCWIHWLSIGSLSVSCYTTIELQPRCHPSFLMRTGDCGAALLPWQQALSHSPHIEWSVHVIPSKPERPAEDIGLVADRTEPALFTSISDDRFLLYPVFPLSLSLMTSDSHIIFAPLLFCIPSNFVETTVAQEIEWVVTRRVLCLVPIKMFLDKSLNIKVRIVCAF